VRVLVSFLLACAPSYDVPQTLTLSLSAGADAGPYQNGSVYASAAEDGFDFFDTHGNPLGVGPYSFDPVQPTPEPGTLPLLTVMCAAIIALHRRREGARHKNGSFRNAII